MKRFYFYLDADLLRQLKLQAKAAPGTSVASLIRAAVRLLLASTKAPTKRLVIRKASK